jgi:transcription elongation factor Elf1
MLDQKKTVNTNEFHWNCERCCSDFIVPSDVTNSLMITATHCPSCASFLSHKFNAYFFLAGN